MIRLGPPLGDSRRGRAAASRGASSRYTMRSATSSCSAPRPGLQQEGPGDVDAGGAAVAGMGEAPCRQPPKVSRRPPRFRARAAWVWEADRLVRADASCRHAGMGHRHPIYLTALLLFHESPHVISPQSGEASCAAAPSNSLLGGPRVGSSRQW